MRAEDRGLVEAGDFGGDGAGAFSPTSGVVPASAITGIGAAGTPQRDREGGRKGEGVAAASDGIFLGGRRLGMVGDSFVPITTNGVVSLLCIRTNNINLAIL